jgi:hypothetical protein
MARVELSFYDRNSREIPEHPSFRRAASARFAKCDTSDAPTQNPYLGGADLLAIISFSSSSI